jgi:hypothetical protein
MKLDRIERAGSGPIFRSRPDAAARFAAACATLPGALVFHDAALDEVSLSFGARTQEVHDRLHALGCRVKLSGWRAQKMLRFAFSGRSFGDDLAHELANVIKLALGEMDVAASRLW